MSRYTISNTPNGRSVAAFLNGELLVTDDSSNPNFDEIVNRLLDEDTEGLDELFSVERAVEKRFQKVSDRVSIKGGHVYFDLVPIDNSLSDHLLRLIQDGDDVTPLVNFWENIAANPSDASKESLLAWLQAENFTITPEGMIVGYKGLRSDRTSIHAGPAVVDGEEIDGHIPNEDGSVIEIARDQVVPDRFQSCAFGLHVGTDSYARSFGHGVTVEVLVNPRDVVSVPTDHSAQKMRVCRYKVVGLSDAKRTENVAADLVDNDFSYSTSGEWQVLSI